MAVKRSAIRTKRIYDPPAKTDGTRILVDRIWPRGMRKEQAALAHWLKDVAPSTALRQWFGHDPARWSEFSRRYRRELTRNEAAVARLCGMAKDGPVTLLYGAHDVEHNNAAVLAAYLGEILRGSDGP